VIVELLAAATDPGAGAELVELGKLLGAGGAGTFALLVWQQIRAERVARTERERVDVAERAARQQELDARLERLSTTLARLDERTAYLIALEHGPGAPRGRRARTPGAGIPIAGRKPTEG
jgi:hypothetical protein